jgi:hypothetical protein
MEEIWKPIKTIKTNSTHHISGDTYYVSNLGRYKLNDEILSIGHGLYVDNGGYLRIVNQGFILAHEVYNAFSISKRPFNMQIHHIDHDRTNNNISNLLCVSDKEHLLIHSTDQLDNSLLLQIEELKRRSQIHILNKEEYKDNWKKYLIERVKKYKIHNKESKNKVIEERKRNNDLQKKELREAMIKSGEYSLNKNGNLYKTNRPNQSSTMKRLYEETTLREVRREQVKKQKRINNSTWCK